MAKALLYGLRKLSVASLKPFSPISFYFRPILHNPETLWVPFRPSMEFTSRNSWWALRNMSHGAVNLVISPQGKPKFETREIDPPKKEKWLTKKRLKLQRKREKQKRKSANKTDPRRLGIKGKKKKQRFANAEERIKDKLEKAKVKEALLIERLKRYEVSQVQGPIVKPHELSGEERFYMKKMAQKSSNYAPIGIRGVFGGVILNMHLHWKKHETVKVICKPCKPGQVNEYANEIARLSAGIPIQVIGDDTIVFYRGKNYVQPEVMSPIDTLSKKRAWEKSKYEQSLESVRRFIAIAEKELELYYRHVALYGDPSDRNPHSILDNPRRLKGPRKGEVVKEETKSAFDICSQSMLQKETDSTDHDMTESEELSEFDDKYSDEDKSASEFDHDYDGSNDQLRPSEATFNFRRVKSENHGTIFSELSSSERTGTVNPCIQSGIEGGIDICDGILQRSPSVASHISSGSSSEMMDHAASISITRKEGSGNELEGDAPHHSDEDYSRISLHRQVTEGTMNNELYDKLQQYVEEAEISRR